MILALVCLAARCGLGQTALRGQWQDTPGGEYCPNMPLQYPVGTASIRSWNRMTGQDSAVSMRLKMEAGLNAEAQRTQSCAKGGSVRAPKGDCRFVRLFRCFLRPRRLCVKIRTDSTAWIRLSQRGSRWQVRAGLAYQLRSLSPTNRSSSGTDIARLRTRRVGRPALRGRLRLIRTFGPLRKGEDYDSHSS